jgi:predicted RNA-binding Zn ribbon-like protein
MPRYDIPKSAPGPLRQVQQFLNSVDVHNGVEWLPEWLTAHNLTRQRTRAVKLREALRSLALANNGLTIDAAALDTLNRAVARVSLRISNGGKLLLTHGGDDLDEIMVIVLGAMLDGTWRRLKACRNCHWSFYDYSPNCSAAWCSMQICGNRSKTRAYRSRRRGRQRGATRPRRPAAR